MTNFPKSTVTIAREGDRFVVTALASWEDDPLVFRTEDVGEALEAAGALLVPGSTWQQVER